MKQYRLPILMLAVFEAVAITLWLTKDNVFYLFNFSYIGLAISLGMLLFIKKRAYARRVVQLLVGAVPCESREYRAHHVPGIRNRKHSVLRYRHHAGARLQGQQGILQIHLPSNCLSEADELLFADSDKMRQGQMHILREV